MNNERGNSPLIAVLVVAVIVIVAFVAYQQGYLGGDKNDSGGVNVDTGGTGY